MRLLFYILILIITNNGYADAQSEAVDKTVQAFMKTEKVKKIIKTAEKKIIAVMPLEKDTAVTIGSTAIMLGSGVVDTRQIKNFNINMLGGKLRPDLTHNFRENKTDAKIKFSIKW